MGTRFTNRGALALWRGVAARNDHWGQALRNAALSGTVVAGTTAASVAIAGERDSGSAIAPLNATSHIAWGEPAGAVEEVDARHTLVGTALHVGACIFWATFYEKFFGRAARRGDVAKALLGGGAIATAAYVTDYHIVPQRLTPGWEYRISKRSLAATYVVLALSLPLLGLLRGRR
jgi:hypothetical protein